MNKFPWGSYPEEHAGPLILISSVNKTDSLQYRSGSIAEIFELPGIVLFEKMYQIGIVQLELISPISVPVL